MYKVSEQALHLLGTLRSFCGLFNSFFQVDCVSRAIAISRHCCPSSSVCHLYGTDFAGHQGRIPNGN